jgi:diguanylate cyclase (GGDEF)-like protein/PAS domain S-box-containing protein
MWPGVQLQPIETRMTSLPTDTPRPAPSAPLAPSNDTCHLLADLACAVTMAKACLVIGQTPSGPCLLASAGLPPGEAGHVWASCSARMVEDLSSADSPWVRMPPIADMTSPWGRSVTASAAQGPVQLILLVAERPDRAWPESTPDVLRQLADRIDLWHPTGLRPSVHATGSDNEALQESASRLELTEHTAGVGSWSASMPDGTMRVSTECASILGVPGPQAIASLADMVACYAPEWRNGMTRRLDRCAQQGMVFDEELQVLVPETGPKWVRSVGAPVRNAQGDIVRIQGAVQDISAQKQAQQETLRLAMRLTTTLASITEAFVTLDREARYTYLNQETERLLQRSTAELLGQPIWNGFEDPLAQRLHEQMDAALSSNRRAEQEHHFPSLNKWLEVRAYPFAEGLAVYFRDVTERRRSQEQLRLLETGVARLNDIVLIAEIRNADAQDAAIVFVNDAFQRHTGYGRDEVLGRAPQMLLDLAPVLERLHDLGAEYVARRQARTELLMHRKNGTMFWVELEVVGVQSDTGEQSHWVAVGRDITQRKAAEDMIRHMALYDPLTDLPNRQLLVERLQRALSQSERSGQHGALMFIDLDNFKILNDTLGHHVGDELLQKVALRLSQSVRKTDTVARLGGDEFVVMVDDLSTDPAAAAYKARVLAEKVLHMLREPFVIDSHQHFATPSIGVTPFVGMQTDVSELLKQADLAMYQAKSLGRNTVCFFDPAMQATVSTNATISAELRTAIREHQFVLHYQPQVDRQGVITGVEALIRWNHPKRGLVAPADFIPVAEDTGLILPMGRWVIETACEQLAAWADWPQTAGLSIAVNVSVHQFRHPDFVETVVDAIRRYGVRPHKLKLELTESLLAERMEVAIQKMGRLKKLGVSLALDDFGVGYSSLSYLKQLPLDQLKIDKGFVADVLTDPHDAAISRAIIALAQSLNLQVVAEGVETQQQRDFLAYQGCDQFQGYLFAPPLPIETLDGFLRNPASGMMVLAGP